MLRLRGQCGSRGDNQRAGFGTTGPARRMGPGRREGGEDQRQCRDGRCPGFRLSQPALGSRGGPMALVGDVAAHRLHEGVPQPAVHHSVPLRRRRATTCSNTSPSKRGSCRRALKSNSTSTACANYGTRSPASRSASSASNVDSASWSVPPCVGTDRRSARRSSGGRSVPPCVGTDLLAS